MKEIETAKQVLLNEIKAGLPPDAALKITQSVLNLSHVEATMESVRKSKETKNDKYPF